MSLLKLNATTKDYLWGGNKLVDYYGKVSAGDVTAESWELSCYPGSESVIENGEFAGKTITEYIAEKGRGVLGSKCERFEDFPVLIKFIDAKKDLSLQVHPSDEYARKNENQYGKTEMWYILEAEEGAFLYYGFNRKITKEEFERRIEEQTLTEVLNKCYVKRGDVIFIESGTLHAIGEGILLAEIQQNSNVTYRVYDYGRRDKNGNLRELHIDKALDVTTLAPPKEVLPKDGHIASCKYFTVDKIDLSDKDGKVFRSAATNDTFIHVLFVDGTGKIQNGTEEFSYKKGDSFFIPAGSGDFAIMGSGEALITYEE